MSHLPRLAFYTPMSVGRTLYRGFLRCFRQYDQAQIPYTGIANSPNGHEAHLIMHPHSRLKEFFQWPDTPPGVMLDAGFKALRLLQHQLAMLSTQSGSDARQALRLWSVMLSNYPQRSEVPLTSLVCATFTSVRHDLRAAQDPDCDLPASEDIIAESNRGVARLARLVQRELQTLPGPDEGVTGTQLALAMRKVLFEDLKFKERPFEWVYEGLQPLELPHVLSARVGPSLTLAALWSCVAGACKLSHVIVPVPQGDAEPDQAEAALLEGLETAVRVRHKSRQVAVAPSLPTWLLALPAGPASRVLPSPEDLGGRPDEMLPPIGDAIAHELQRAAASQPGAALPGTPPSSVGLPAGATAEELQQAAAGQPGAHLAAADPAGLAAGPKRAEWVFMDPAKGHVLSQAECARQYPTLSQTLWDSGASDLCLAADFVRAAIIAHQRRGESDEVAAWMWQLMALDTQCEYWQMFPP